MQKLVLYLFIAAGVLVSDSQARFPFYQSAAAKSCPEGHEISFNPSSRKLDCSCKSYHLYWPETGLCYPELSQGPCHPGHKLTWNSELEQAECRCPTFWSLAKDGHCYEEYTQGPCEKGRLFIQGQCLCNQTMAMHYYKELDQCFQLYTQGPCSSGQILQFNYTKLQPECVCRDGYVRWNDGNCYELNTVGPCQSLQCPSETPVACFVSDVLETTCTCLKKKSVADNGKCYLPYNQGPCSPGQWFVYGKDSERSKCQSKNWCAMFDNWYKWDQDGSCYRQFSQGPCKPGKLFYLDPETGVASCDCKASWKPYIHDGDGSCYEMDSIGPCPAGKYFFYNSTAKRSSCTCFANYILDPSSDTCIEKFTRGTCPLGQLAVVDPDTGNFKCSCTEEMKEHFDAATKQCFEHFAQGPCRNGQVFRLDDKNLKKPACLPPIGRRKKRNY